MAGLSIGAPAALERFLIDTKPRLRRTATPVALERMVLRCPIVQAWRQLVLCRQALPALVHPDGWRAPACDARVHRLMEHPPGPALTGS
jgi:hypothetical protein